VGFGSSGPPVGDFSFGGGAAPAQIPSGSHYPRQGTTVDLWANWYDTAGPKRVRVVVDGLCTTMALERGSQENGAWHAKVTGLSNTCHRYWFSFDSVDYPTTGTLGIGPAGSCADWSSDRPAMDPSCSDVGTVDGGSGGSDGGAGGGGPGCACDVARSGSAIGTALLLLALLCIFSRRVTR
jgi:hypothetical protein